MRQSRNEEMSLDMASEHYNVSESQIVGTSILQRTLYLAAQPSPEGSEPELSPMMPTLMGAIVILCCRCEVDQIVASSV